MNPDDRTKEYRNFSREVFFVAVAQLLPKIKNFITFPIITKALGAENYGIWSQIQVTLGLFLAIASMGINTAMRRFLPGEKDRSKVRNDFWAATLLILLNGLILLVVLYFFSPFIVQKLFKTQDALFLLRLASLLIPLSVVNQVLMEYFVTFQQSKVYAFFKVMADAATVSLILYFLLQGSGLLAVILISILVTAASSIIAALVVIKQIGIRIPRFNILRPYLKLGFPLCITGYAAWLIHSGDRYVIGYFMDITAVGIYSGVYALSNLIMAISSPIHFVLLPTISRYWESHEIDKARKYIEYSVRYYLMIGIPAVFGLSVLAKELLTSLATADFATAWFLVPIIAVGILILQGWYPSQYILILAKRSNLILTIALVAAVENLVLNIITVPVLGIAGAAISTLITYISYASLYILFSRRYLTFSIPYSFIIKSVAASLAMVFFLLFIPLKTPLGLLAKVLLGGLLYFTFLFFMKGLDFKQLKILFGRY